MALWLGLAVWGCGPLVEEEEANIVLIDHFNTYSSFPADPWAVISGDSSSWSITSSSGGPAARFYSSSALDSCLLNGDFNDPGKTGVSAKINITSVHSSGGAYGLYLRAAGDLSSYYEMIISTAGGKLYIYRVNGGLASELNAVSMSVGSYLGSYHTYTFRLYENDGGSVTLAAYVDGALMTSGTDYAPLTSGYYTGFLFHNVLEGYISTYQIATP
jgi:hypothetical protein